MNPGNWTSIAPLVMARSHPATAVHDNRIYVFGGGGPAFQSLNTTEVYEPQQGQWRPCRAMPSLRSGSVAVAFGDSIYVIGGGFKQADGRFRFLRTLEIYTPKLDQWQRGPDMLQPHDYPAVVLMGEFIYIMGGHHPDASSRGPKTDPGFDFCERYNLITAKWEAIAPLPTSRFALAAVVKGQTILSMGGVAFTPEGFNNFNVVEAYDVAQNRWQLEPSYTLPWPAAGLVACKHVSNCYIFGGYSGQGIHARGACYRQGQWFEIESMPAPRAAMGVASLSQGIYIIGGWADDGRTPVASGYHFHPSGLTQ